MSPFVPSRKVPYAGQRVAVSKVERRTDLYISTLRKHIEAMGGTLIIQAEFPKGRYQLESFGGMAEERADQGG